MRVSVLRVQLNHYVEVLNCLLVLFNHLIGFRTFMDVIKLVGVLVDTESQWENSFFKFFNSAVGEGNVIVNFTLVSKERFVFQRILEILHAFFIFS